MSDKAKRKNPPLCAAPFNNGDNSIAAIKHDDFIPRGPYYYYYSKNLSRLRGSAAYWNRKEVKSTCPPVYRTHFPVDCANDEFLAEEVVPPNELITWRLLRLPVDAASDNYGYPWLHGCLPVSLASPLEACGDYSTGRKSKAVVRI